MLLVCFRVSSGFKARTQSHIDLFLDLFSDNYVDTVSVPAPAGHRVSVVQPGQTLCGRDGAAAAGAATSNLGIPSHTAPCLPCS